MEIGITLAVAALLGLIPASIAKNKGYSFGLWWFYGWMLFIIAIIHVAIIPDKTQTHTGYQMGPDGRMYPAGSNQMGQGYSLAPPYQMNSGYPQPQMNPGYPQPQMNSGYQQTPGNMGQTGAQGVPAGNVIDEIMKYKSLYDQGILTEEEFNQKKKKLLGL